VTFWQRAPREVYRVYGEEEYLAEDNPEVHAEGDMRTRGERYAERDAHSGTQTWPSPLKTQRPHSRRLIGLGLLASVTAGAFGLIVLNVSRRPLVAPRPDISQGAEERAARRRSAGALAEPKSAVPASATAVSNRRLPVARRNRAKARQSARLRSSTRGPVDLAPGPASAEIEQLRSPIYESDAAAVLPLDHEFDFER
jgi:hypothetical protein